MYIKLITYINKFEKNFFFFFYLNKHFFLIVFFIFRNLIKIEIYYLKKKNKNKTIKFKDLFLIKL
jgi:hypothetical protein